MDKDGRRSMFRNYLRSGLPEGVTDLADARQIPIARLSPNPFQPRSNEGFDPSALDELAASIREHGVLQPLLVRQHPDDPELYQIAAGERRWRAAPLAGLDTVPSVVRELDDRQMRELALVENVFREDLSPLDLAHALQQMMDVFGLSARALSARLGKNHSYVDDKIRIARDPRIAAAVKIGTLGPTVALEIAEMDDEKARASLLARAGRGERIKVKDVQATTQERAMPVKPAASPTESGHVDRQDGHDHLNRHDPFPTALSSPMPTVPVKPAPPSVGVESSGTWAGDAPSAPGSGHVRLRDLRLIQLREGRDGEPRQLDTADKATVLRIMRADLAWLERDGTDRDA